MNLFYLMLVENHFWKSQHANKILLHRNHSLFYSQFFWGTVKSRSIVLWCMKNVTRVLSRNFQDLCLSDSFIFILWNLTYKYIDVWTLYHVAGHLQASNVFPKKAFKVLRNLKDSILYKAILINFSFFV